MLKRLFFQFVPVYHSAKTGTQSRCQANTVPTFIPSPRNGDGRHWGRNRASRPVGQRDLRAGRATRARARANYRRANGDGINYAVSIDLHHTENSAGNLNIYGRGTAIAARPSWHPVSVGSS